jgi:lipopolysaccharide transport system permease protein
MWGTTVPRGGAGHRWHVGPFRWVHDLWFTPVPSFAIELWQARNLLRNLIGRDLNSRYKGSSLGIVWSLLNPLLLMAVYTIVFSTVARFETPDGVSYPIFFLAGFLPWTFFGMAVQLGANTLLQNAGLIQKIYFPREVLPLSMSVAALANMLFGLALFIPIDIIIQEPPVLGLLVLVPLTAFLFVFGASLAMLFSVLTVYFRDTEFLLGNALTAWFFLSPIVYDIDSTPSEYRWLFEINPVAPFIEGFRDVLIQAEVPSALRVGSCALIAVVSLVVCGTVFRRLTGRIAEEL